MICTKCGQENPDDLKHCLGCGHKLQSGLKPWSPGTVIPESPILAPKGLGPAARKKARKHVEAWVVGLLTGVAAYWLVVFKCTWPLYPLTLLAGIYAWLRGITWHD